MTGRLYQELRNLQRYQLEHDQLAHKQVLSWPFQRRMTHFALHFAKYQATLLTTDPLRNSVSRRRVLTDSLIIALASANCLGVQLADYCLLKNVDARTPVLVRYIAEVGRMAKACEAMDHAEPFDYRHALETAVIVLTSLIAELAESEPVDLVEATRQRWKEIEGDVSKHAALTFDYGQQKECAVGNQAH